MLLAWRFQPLSAAANALSKGQSKGRLHADFRPLHCCNWFTTSLENAFPAVWANHAAFGFALKRKRVDSLMARTNPITFFQQVRTEVSKVTWPSRQEVLISTIMVLVLVTAASLFFLAADSIIAYLVSLVLSIRA